MLKSGMETYFLPKLPLLLSESEEIKKSDTFTIVRESSKLTLFYLKKQS